MTIFPEWSLCSLTYEQLVEPVICPLGLSYERSIIERLKSDITGYVSGELGIVMNIKQFIPNESLKCAINQYNMQFISKHV